MEKTEATINSRKTKTCTRNEKMKVSPCFSSDEYQQGCNNVNIGYRFNSGSSILGEWVKWKGRVVICKSPKSLFNLIGSQ